MNALLNSLYEARAKEALLIAKYKAQIEAMRASMVITINPEYLAAARARENEAV